MARQRPWALNQYNRQAMEKRTNSEIDREYSRLSSTVKKRVQTFEKHSNKLPTHVKAVKEIVDRENASRREKESALIEMRRYLNLDTSSYTKFAKIRRQATRVWIDIGLTRADLTEDFFDFLEWTRSLQGYQYNANAVKEAWQESANLIADRNFQAAKTIYSQKIIGNKRPGELTKEIRKISKYGR